MTENESIFDPLLYHTPRQLGSLFQSPKPAYNHARLLFPRGLNIVLVWRFCSAPNHRFSNFWENKSIEGSMRQIIGQTPIPAIRAGNGAAYLVQAPKSELVLMGKP